MFPRLHERMLLHTLSIRNRTAVLPLVNGLCRLVTAVDLALSSTLCGRGLAAEHVDATSLLKFSVSMASCRPIKPSRGPAVICTVSPTLKSTVSGAAFSTPIFSTSSAERGTGLEAGPTKPAAARVGTTIPGIVDHHHFDQNGNGEQLVSTIFCLPFLSISGNPSRRGTLMSRVRSCRWRFLHHGLQVVDLVLITGIGMHNMQEPQWTHLQLGFDSSIFG